MKQGQALFAAVVGFSFAFSGCARVTTQVVDKPRVDQETKGNRGYLVGSAPPAAERKTTRKMVQTDVELPTAEELNPWKVKQAAPQAPAAATTPAPVVVEPEASTWQPPAQEEQQQWQADSEPVQEAPVREATAETTYIVQKGDNLEKISKKFYGTSRKWKKIYDANKPRLKSPDQLYAGQKLTIPAESELLLEEERTQSQYK